MPAGHSFCWNGASGGRVGTCNQQLSMGCFVSAFSLRNQWNPLYLAVFLFFLWSTSKPGLAASSPVVGAVPFVDAVPYRLTVLVEPPEAKVEILNLDIPYQPSMFLNPGRYYIAVSSPGYDTEKGFIEIIDRNWMGKVTLRPIAVPASLDDAWRKLGEEKRRLEQQRRELAQERDKLERSKKKIAKEGRARSSGIKNRPATPAWFDVTPPTLVPVRSGRVLQGRTMPATTPTFKRAITSKPSKRLITSPPPKRAMTSKNLVVPLHSRTVQQGRAMPATTPVNKRATRPRSLVASLHSKTPQGGSMPATTPIKRRVTTSGRLVAPLLEDVMAYLKQPALPGKNLNLPESQEALLKLRQAQKLAPGNASVKLALQLHANRYLVYAGLFEKRSGANKMVARIRALGLPTFQQPILVNGRPAIRVCVGLFLRRDEAIKSLQHLQEKLQLKDAFLRAYRG